ncbi:MAG TPA: AMP-binding protein [Pyrinomonadaceae bacterium]|jgi:long-chain acyl-CoA synthetase|nr:AMP-binding protein [Pyrinomonadaceae bacterium]
MESARPGFCQRVVDAATVRPDKVAMTMLSSTGFEHITFGSMLEQIRSIAYRLEQAGVDFGDRVAIISENHPNWAIAYLGILYRGAVVTPLDPSSTISSLATFLAHSESKLAFVSAASLEKFREACEQLGRVIPAVHLQLLPQADESFHFETRFSDWARTPVPPEFISIAPQAATTDLALLIYTSGTTGQPKAVPLTHGNIQAQIDGVEEVMKITDREVVLSILPLFHAYSQIVNLWLAATIGARVVYLNQFGSAEIEEGLKRCGATALTGVPRLWYLFHQKVFDTVNTKPAPLRWLFRGMLLGNGILRDFFNINAGSILFRPVHRAFGGKLRLAVSGGATFDEAVANDFHRLGFTILQGYGLTETSGAVTVTRFEDNRIGSVGTPLNGIEIKLDQPGESGIGEVLIRGPMVTEGYYRNHEANREAFTPDQWFRSGDLGRFDRQGHLYIVGRKKDVIVLPSGKNVFPEDVEAHYEKSPLVNEICVLGRRDANSRFAGAEALCAIVVPNFEFLRAQRIINPGEWIPWELEDLGRELPEYQRVHDFIVRTESLPRTLTRKVRRFELRQEIEARSVRGLDRLKGKPPVLRPIDQELMDSTAGRAVTAIIKERALDSPAIHPLLNLEIDLRLDSLARVECLTKIEQTLGVRFEPDEMTSAFTVGELVELVSRKTNERGGSTLGSETLNERVATATTPATPHWHQVLSDTSTSIRELQPLLNRSRLRVIVAVCLLKAIYLGARLLLNMEVRGSAVLKNLKPPFLLCPNHQSYIDPFLVCSVLPLKVLANIFHVGASRYFNGTATSQLARLINVVPIDPDVHLLRAMRAGAVILGANKVLNVYPEGRRSFDGQLGVFKKGAAILATELNVPIVPVALDGTYRIWPRGSARIRFARVKIAFGEPIQASGVTLPDADAGQRYEKVMSLVKERVSEMLKEMREN